MHMGWVQSYELYAVDDAGAFQMRACDMRSSKLKAYARLQCKFASMITCTTCWQTIPVAHYDEHKDGSQGILMI